MRRALLNPNTKVQLLALLLLETCAKNCSRTFHMRLAESDLWLDMLRICEGSKQASFCQGAAQGWWCAELVLPPHRRRRVVTNGRAPGCMRHGFAKALRRRHGADNVFATRLCCDAEIDVVVPGMTFGCFWFQCSGHISGSKPTDAQCRLMRAKFKTSSRTHFWFFRRPAWCRYSPFRHCNTRLVDSARPLFISLILLPLFLAGRF